MVNDLGRMFAFTFRYTRAVVAPHVTQINPPRIYFRCCFCSHDHVESVKETVAAADVV